MTFSCRHAGILNPLPHWAGACSAEPSPYQAALHSWCTVQAFPWNHIFQANRSKVGATARAHTQGEEGSCWAASTVSNCSVSAVRQSAVTHPIPLTGEWFIGSEIPQQIKITFHVLESFLPLSITLLSVHIEKHSSARPCDASPHEISATTPCFMSTLYISSF